jgi:hypothetical protein
MTNKLYLTLQPNPGRPPGPDLYRTIAGDYYTYPYLGVSLDIHLYSTWESSAQFGTSGFT